MYADQLSQRIISMKSAVATGDYTDALFECAGLARKCFANNFMKGGNQKDTWPPRKDPLLTHPLLMLSLAMFNATTQVSAPGSATINTGRYVDISVDLNVVPYARAQNYGYPPRNLPMRKFMVLDDETKVEIRKILSKRTAELIIEAMNKV